MAITPVNASVTVTTAGTRVQVNSSAAIKPTAVYFEALGSNTGFIYVGLVSVTSTLYMAKLGVSPTSVGMGFSITAPGAGSSGFKLGGQGLQLSDFYIDSSVSGEKCLVTYVYSTGG
jgi:hypothetical protein